MFDEISLATFWSAEWCKSVQELSNEHLLAKLGDDTAENEPYKVFC